MPTARCGHVTQETAHPSTAESFPSPLHLPDASPAGFAVDRTAAQCQACLSAVLSVQGSSAQDKDWLPDNRPAADSYSQAALKSSALRLMALHWAAVAYSAA